MSYICSKCNAKIDVSTRKAKCDCGGLWKLDFKPPKFDLSLVDESTWKIYSDTEPSCPLRGSFGVI